MGALVPRSSLVVSFLLLLLPTAAYCDYVPYNIVQLSTFQDKNCSVGEQFILQTDINIKGNRTGVNGTQPSFQSAILKDVTNNIQQLSACQLEFDCNATGAILIPFDLSIIPGPCVTAGPPGTLFNKFFWVDV